MVGRPRKGAKSAPILIPDSRSRAVPGRLGSGTGPRPRGDDDAGRMCPGLDGRMEPGPPVRRLGRVGSAWLRNGQSERGVGRAAGPAPGPLTPQGGDAIVV